MPNDVEWGCKDCDYFANGYCFEHMKMKREWDLCPEWTQRRVNK